MQVEFDTHAMATKLQKAGFKAEMAEAVTYAIRDIAMTNVATHNDVKEAVQTMTLRVGAMLAFGITALGVLIALTN